VRERRGTMLGSYAGLALYGIPVLLGVLAGLVVASSAAQPGVGGGPTYRVVALAIQATVWIVLGGAVLAAAAGVVGADRRVAAAANVAVVAAAVAAFGGLAGLVLGPGRGLDYSNEVILETGGTMTGTIDAPGFSPTPDARATCQSVPDGQAVDLVTGLGLGRLNDATLRASVAVSGLAEEAPVELWLDAADEPDGAPQPFWHASGQIEDRSADGRSGRVTYADARIDSKDGSKDGGNDGGSTTDGWPATFSGELTWSCDDWSGPRGPEPAEPGMSAMVELGLADPGWEPSGGGGASCEQDPEGTVHLVVAPTAGRLQGLDVTAELDMPGGVEPGQEARLAIRVSSKEQPSGLELVPAWDGPVVLGEVEPGGWSGHVTFNSLPSVGDQLAGWPATLSGELTWACG
jgi:hypothetical protein